MSYKREVLLKLEGEEQRVFTDAVNWRYGIEILLQTLSLQAVAAAEQQNRAWRELRTRHPELPKDGGTTIRYDYLTGEIFREIWQREEAPDAS